MLLQRQKAANKCIVQPLQFSLCALPGITLLVARHRYCGPHIFLLVVFVSNNAIEELFIQDYKIIGVFVREVRRSSVHPSTQTGSPQPTSGYLELCPFVDQKTPTMKPAQFPRETCTPAQLPQGGKDLLIFSLNLFAFSFSSQFLILPPFTTWFQLLGFPQVLRVACKYSQSLARMNHFSLTASSHRANAPDPWVSRGSSAEFTSRMDVVLWIHPNDGWDEGHNHY